LLAAVLPADEEAAQAALDEGETITAPIAAGLVREARQGLVIAGAMREVARAAASSDIVQIAVERVERRALREPAPVEADQDGSGIP
ncbi:MAG: hypothetical protein K8H88_11395, partial [Sandaracinaceae bacterium]|nr:hypothetical protein [Sandaracinaceae bacterium]